MKKSKSILIKQALFASLCCSIVITANAQNLPKIQQSNLRAPTNIKIDGKTTEWNDQFQAFQSVSRVFYTVSNDDDNLYLTIRTRGVFGSEKAVDGITFTIRPGSKGFPQSAITYPIFDEKKTDDIKGIILHAEDYRKDTTLINKNKLDSLSRLANKHIDNLFKEFEVSGIKEITDPLVSIYNAYQLKVRVQFDSKMLYVYELAIPLKYLGISINTGEKFTYNIKLNGAPDVAANGHHAVQFDNPVAALKPDALYMWYPTDFSGDYSLAKK